MPQWYWCLTALGLSEQSLRLGLFLPVWLAKMLRADKGLRLNRWLCRQLWVGVSCVVIAATIQQVGQQEASWCICRWKLTL